jgi:hypothetical protein
MGTFRLLPSPLETFGDLPYSVCVSCSKRECSRGFVEVSALEVPILNELGDEITALDFNLCATCLERIVCAELGGISEREFGQKQAEVSAEEEEAKRAEAEALLWAERLRGLRQLFDLPKPWDAPETPEEEAERICGGRFCLECGRSGEVGEWREPLEVMPLWGSHVWIHSACMVGAQSHDGSLALREKIFAANAEAENRPEAMTEPKDSIPSVSLDGYCVNECGRRVSGLRSQSLCGTCLDEAERSKDRTEKLGALSESHRKFNTAIEDHKAKLAEVWELERTSEVGTGELILLPVTECLLSGEPTDWLVCITSVGAENYQDAQEALNLRLRSDWFGLNADCHTETHKAQALEQLQERSGFFLAPHTKDRRAFYVREMSTRRDKNTEG